MRSRTLWMPCKLKHDITETLKRLRTGKTFKPYVHVKGKLISHMDSDAVEEAWLCMRRSPRGGPRRPSTLSAARPSRLPLRGSRSSRGGGPRALRES